MDTRALPSPAPTHYFGFLDKSPQPPSEPIQGVYGIPFNAERFLKLDPMKGTSLEVLKFALTLREEPRSANQ